MMILSDIVYVLTNDAMPGYIKVGITDDLTRRLKELDQTNTPLPFTCAYACKINNNNTAVDIEKSVLEAFEEHRVRKNREFLLMPPNKVIAVLKLLGEDITPKQDIVNEPSDQDALNKARRERFRFSMVGIPIGAELAFESDNSIKAKVATDKKIEYQGDTTSLSGSAQKILGVDYVVSGTTWWTYEGETLDERRRRLAVTEQD